MAKIVQAINSLIPSRFAYFAAPGQTFEIRFYIQHRSVVHSVAFAGANFKTPDKEESATCLA